jgi:polyhydroxyalkanoate synthase
VNPANIQAAFLNVVAEYDHIVSQSQSTSIMDRISSEDKELRIIPSTHVGLMASHRARYKLWPELVEWLGTRSN